MGLLSVDRHAVTSGTPIEMKERVPLVWSPGEPAAEPFHTMIGSAVRQVLHRVGSLSIEEREKGKPLAPL